MYFLFYIFWSRVHIAVDGLQFWSFSLCFPDSSSRYRQVPSQPVSVWYLPPPSACKFNYSWLGIAHKQLPIFSLLCATRYQYFAFYLLVSHLSCNCPAGSTVLNLASAGQLYLPLTWLAFDTRKRLLSLVWNRINAIGVPELADGWLLNIKGFLQVLGSI